jgi:RNA polymerase sigma-70 factor (ECF subfamily)
MIVRMLCFQTINFYFSSPNSDPLSKDDKTLVTQLKNDSRKAFEEIFKKYADRIYYFSIKYLKSKEDAEEITQEVFVRLWNRRFDLKTELSFSSYLFMIAKNAVIDMLRKRQKESVFNEEINPSVESTLYEDNKSVEYKELNNIIQKSIADLPLKRRQIYLLSRDEGLTYKQIAEKLNISIKTVESHMRLALQQLKKSVGDQYELILLGILFIPFIA